MTPTADEHLRGYRAAAKCIKEFTESAQKDRPHRTGQRKPSGMTRTASYREGYFMGLVAAEAAVILGEHPLVPQNAHTIMCILRDEDAAACLAKKK